MYKIYSGYTCYGPYYRKDGRQHVILTKMVNGKLTKKTVSYPKYLMEKHLNRYLDIDETIDHIDRDFRNNNINNLQILPKAEHARLDAIKADYSAQSFTCPFCSSIFILEGEKLRRAKYNSDRHTAGPFCSRSCAGKASHTCINIKSKIKWNTYLSDKLKKEA